MKSPKESSLAVSHSLPAIPFLKREAKLCADEFGYLFVQYSGDAQIQERFNAEALTELLKIIPVIEYMYDDKGKMKHGVYNLPEIEPEKILAYINRFGVVGISDIDFRNETANAREPLRITQLMRMSHESAQKLCKEKPFNPKFVVRLMAIREGDEVPYIRIERILKDLAKSARLYINLLEDPNFAKKEVLSLTDKNRKRIVSAWSRSGGAFKDSEDPADPKFNTREEWTYTKSGEPTISVLDFAEGDLGAFSQVINGHLSLISKSVVTTQGVREFNLQNTGLETAFSAYLVNLFKDKKKVKSVCVECGSVFLPIRVKEENRYCGESCSKKVRNRNYKAKKKVSASKAGSTATSKIRKEKK